MCSASPSDHWLELFEFLCVRVDDVDGFIASIAQEVLTKNGIDPADVE